jgi:mannan endo-1,4-beta-mannosidase
MSLRHPMIALGTALALALGTAAVIAPPASAHGNNPPPPMPVSQQFVQRSGDQLTLGGRPFRFAGTNNYYLMYKSHLMTDAVLEKAAANNFDVVRTWAFTDIGLQNGTDSVDPGNTTAYFQYWNGSAPAFNDGATGLERLDYVVAKAKAEGVRLVLPLTNNWSNFGGMDQYVKWAGGTYHSDFYSNPTIRDWYKTWIDHLLNRVNTITGIKYKDDPTIMAWELANEPRCGGSGVFPKDPACNVATLQSWVEDMSAHIKSVDDKHLVATGDEGFLCTDPTGTDWTTNCNEGVDAIAFAKVPTIDLMSFHLYPNSWGKDAAWGTAWITDHFKAAKKIHKPAILGEFGWSDKATRNVVYKDWLDAVIKAHGTGALYWILSDVQDDGTLYPDYDGYTVYCPSPVCTTIRNFGTTLTTGWRFFPPVADNDVAITEFETPVDVPILANDIAYGVRLLPSTVDLDPATPGLQTTGSTANASYSVNSAGVLHVVPVAGFAGKITLSYTVRDLFRRMSNVATVNVTVKPSPTAAQVLFDFSGGTQGWASQNSTDVTSVLKQTAAGTLSIQSAGYWFGAGLIGAPLDLSTRTQLTYDLVSTTGTNASLVLQLGPGWDWCEIASGDGWLNAPRVGANPVKFDLTALSASCKAQLGQAHGMYLSFNSGSQSEIDNITVN